MKKVISSLSFLVLIFMFSCVEQTDLLPELPANPAVQAMSSSQGNPEGYPWQNHAAPFDFLFGNHIDTHQQTQLTGNDKLKGFFYITFTGNETEEGVPVAMHGNCNMHANCTVGWILDGIPVEATLMSHGMGHPTWCVDPDDMPNQPGYTHFHWSGDPEHAGGISVGETRSGYLLKLTARETFFFKHHGGYLITPGIDYESHANVVTDCE